MSDEKDILFEAVTPLGFHVRVTKAYWELIVKIKHPIMAGREVDVKTLWKIQTKSAAVNRMKTSIYFTRQNTKRDGFVLFPNRPMTQDF